MTRPSRDLRHRGDRWRPGPHDGGRRSGPDPRRGDPGARPGAGRRTALGTGLALVLAGLCGGAAVAGDIRTLTVGEPVTGLSSHGYGTLECVAPDGALGDPLADWAAATSCPADAAGLRSVRVTYDDSTQEWAPVNDKWTGTRVAGHPVELIARIDAGGILEAIHVRTDPEARSYLHKKAFLLGNKVKSHYGRAGWRCDAAAPSTERRDVGGTFFDETCEKVTDGRRIVLQTSLYRDAADEIVNATEFEVKRLPHG